MSTPATDAPTARARIEIAKPIAHVRAQFFDVARMIETQPHHGVKLTWAPAHSNAGDEKRARQEIRVLGDPIVDDFVIADEDGAWVKHVVEGTNAGARYVATFEAVGDGATAVELAAFAPPGPKGFNLGLGKLSALGLEKALRKMLDEHQKAIEAYAFAPGSARAPVKSVLGGFDDLTLDVRKLQDREKRALVATLLEAASLVALADHDADAAEREVMDEVARDLAGQELDDETRTRLVKGAERALGSDGMATRCEKLGQRLNKLGHVELGLVVAATVAAVSHGIDAPELAALQKLASGGGLPEAALSSILDRVDEEMESALPRAAKATTTTTTKKNAPPPLPPKASEKKKKA